MKRFMQKLKSGKKVIIVALGDSITELTWHTRGYLSWTGLLQEALFEKYRRNRCFVINSGFCGDNAITARKRIDEDVIRFNPDLVIISFGMNDACNDPNPEGFHKAMLEIIHKIKAESEADIMLRTPNPIINMPVTPYLPAGQNPAVEMTGAYQGVYAAEIIKIGKEEDCVVVDHYTEWRKVENLRGTMAEEPNHAWLYMSDPVHPGPLGHMAFYRQLAPYFELPKIFPWETLV